MLQQSIVQVGKKHMTRIKALLQYGKIFMRGGGYNIPKNIIMHVCRNKLVVAEFF